MARGVSRQESQVADTSTGIRWAEVKTSGVSCRSARMKLPARWERKISLREKIYFYTEKYFNEIISAWA